MLTATSKTNVQYLVHIMDSQTGAEAGGGVYGHTTTDMPDTGEPLPTIDSTRPSIRKKRAHKVRPILPLASHPWHNRMQLALHETRRNPHGASALGVNRSVCSRCRRSQGWERGGGVYARTTITTTTTTTTTIVKRLFNNAIKTVGPFGDSRSREGSPPRDRSDRSWSIYLIYLQIYYIVHHLPLWEVVQDLWNKTDPAQETCAR